MMKWYKGNLHSHTTNSDGLWTPEQAAENYYNSGYSFLCLTDHDLYTDYRKQLARNDFLILPGVEAAAVLYDDNGDVLRVHHMNGILGTRKMQENSEKGNFRHMERVEPDRYYRIWDGKKAAQKLVRRLKAHGCIVTYNHPIWSRVELHEVIDIPGIDLWEIYNYNTENESGTGADTIYWDMILRCGKKMNADAVDDNHNGAEFPDSFGGSVMVEAEELSHDSICEALICGRYYSTSGPEIYKWKIKEEYIEIECSPVERINFVVGGTVGMGKTYIGKNGKKLTGATYHFSGKEQYVRIECVDEMGKKAWTNPVFYRK